MTTFRTAAMFAAFRAQARRQDKVSAPPEEQERVLREIEELRAARRANPLRSVKAIAVERVEEEEMDE